MEYVISVLMEEKIRLSCEILRMNKSFERLYKEIPLFEKQHEIYIKLYYKGNNENYLLTANEVDTVIEKMDNYLNELKDKLDSITKAIDILKEVKE